MLGDDVESLVEEFQSVAPDGVRVALWYDGDAHGVEYARDDVRTMYSPEEFDEKTKQLVVEGLSDPPNQEQFRLFGEMNVVVRQFDRAVMVHFPIDEFRGIAVTFDDDAVSSLDPIVAIGTDYVSSQRPNQ